MFHLLYRLPCRWGLAALLVAGAPAHAASVLFTADLTNGHENPPATPLTTAGGAPRPASFGTATFVLNDAETALTFTATVFNIDFTGTQTADPNDNLIAAHIHAGAGVTPTTNAGVVFGFIGTPFNDLSPNDTVVTPFASDVGGTVSTKWDLPEGNNGTTLTEQLPFILSDRAYLNFHTTQFPGGEVRGTLTVVPLPPAAAAGLLTLALGGAASFFMRMRARARAIARRP